MSDINKMIQYYRNSHDFQVNFMTYNDDNPDNCAPSLKPKNYFMILFLLRLEYLYQLAGRIGKKI